MARIKTPTNGLTPQEEVFAQELAYLCLGQNLGKIGEDVRYEPYLYMAYKKAYPRTKANITSLYSMASRLAKKVKIRSRFEQLLQAQEAAICEATADDVKKRLNALLGLTPMDYVIQDPDTGVWRKRKEHELSVTAFWAVKRISRYGYDRLSLVEIVDSLAKLNGWNAATTLNHHVEGDVTAEDIVLTFGGKKYKNTEQ